jgi:hypothetical protein
LPGKLFGACNEGHSLLLPYTTGQAENGVKGLNILPGVKAKYFSLKRPGYYVHLQIFRPSSSTAQKGQVHREVAIPKSLPKRCPQVNSRAV